MDTTSIVMLAVGVVAGAAGGFGASRLRGGAAAATPVPAAEQAASDSAEPEGDESAGKDPAGFEIAAQRRALIDASIGIADLVRNSDEALWRQLTDALATAGVTMVAPDGKPFDPEQHVSVLAEPTEDEKLHQTVAATDTVGYLDGKTWLRRAEVAVYQQGPQA
jgi:hypothetical protein